MSVVLLLVQCLFIVMVLYCIRLLKHIESEVRALMRLRRIENKLAESNHHARVWYADEKGKQDAKQ